MKKFGSLIRNLKLEKKLTAAYSAVVLLSVVLLFAVIYIPFSGYLRKNAIEYNYSMMEIANRSMEKRYLDLDKLSMLISVDSKLAEYLEGIQTYGLREKYDRAYSLEADFGNILTYNSDLGGIYVVPFGTHELVKSDYQPYRMDMYPENNGYFQEFCSSKEAKTALLREGEDGTRVVFLRKIYSLSSGKLMGILQICSSPGNSYGNGENVLGLADGRGSILYLEGGVSDGERLYDLMSQNGGTSTVRIDSRDYLLSSFLSETFGWYLFSMVPADRVQPDIWHILVFVSFSSLTVFFLLSLCSARIARGIAKPLKKLEETMEKVQEGNFEVCVQNPSMDEIGQLSRNFNQMVERIKSLIEQVYLLDIKEKEAELIALQNQIEPHFLYNTLESIRNLAVLNDDEETARMITSLGKFLRLKISGTIKTIPLETELEHTASYVELMKMKYGDRLRFTVLVNESGINFQVVKLILQPLVENAVLHGFCMEREGLAITVSVKESEEDFLLIVEDNGKGIAGERLEEIRKELAAETGREREERIGLKNVHTRVRLAFGAAYGLEIESFEGKGTRVMIKMPVNGREDNEM